MGGHNADDGSVREEYDWSVTRPSIAVIDAVAHAEDVEITDVSSALDTTLYERVDPDALDTLVSASDHVSISFSVADYDVQIEGDEVVVSDE
ncbi:HalOD1 output domain-containing protein [Saliphagus sp. GCM10025317]